MYHPRDRFLRPRPFRRVAALSATVLAAFLPLACGGDSGTGPGGGNGGGGGTGGSGSASVTVSPSSASLDALGASRDFSGSGTDAQGASLSESDLTWSSSDGSVATVDGSGVATARGNGMAEIVAAYGAAADTAQLTVEQRAATVTVTPDSVNVAAAGDTAHFAASAEDANGSAVADASFTWSSTDGSVATVDGSGVATAQGAGIVRIVATAGSGVADSAIFVVDGGGGGGSGAEPVIDAVSPDTLEEGGTATITGRDFGAAAGENTVLVDGIEATVTMASETELQVTVPQYDCRPLRTAEVRVAVDGDTSAAVGTMVRPDEGPVSLAQGERLVIESPGDGFCLQFGASSSDEEYLVGVQSASEALGTTAVVLESEVGSTGAGTSVPLTSDPVAAPAGTWGGGSASGLALGSVDARWPRHYRHEARIRQWEDDVLMPRKAEALARPIPGDEDGDSREGPSAALASSVPGSVSEGDTVDLRVPDDLSGDLCDDYAAIQAVVRKVGDHGIWVEDLANPASGYSSSDWTELSDTFDDLVYPTNTDHFGDPTDLDGNGRVVMVVTKVVNEMGGILGFVTSGDLFLRSGSGFTCASSDEGELTYLLAPDPTGIHGTAWSVEDLKRDNPRLVAHEFTHMIQFGVQVNCSACNGLAAFILEGQAVVAEEVNGHAETGRAPGVDYGSDVAWDDDDSDPRPWYDNRFIDLAVYFGYGGSGVHHASAPEDCSWLARDWSGVCTGSRGVYGVPSTIIRWMADQFGPGYPGGEQGLLQDMIASTDPGYGNWEELTGLGIKEILAYFGPMLWTDGRVTTSDGLMEFPSWDLFDIFDSRVPEARLQPFVRSFTDFSDSFGVNAGSAAYVLLGGSSRPHAALRARAPGGGTLASYMQMWVVRTK